MSVRALPVPPDLVAFRAKVDAEIAGATVLSGFLGTAGRLGPVEALRWREGPAWRSLTWSAYRDLVAAAAAGLEHAGLRAGDVLVMVSRNRMEPHVLDLAAQAAGAVPVSAHATLAPGQVVDIVAHSAATVVAVEDDRMRAALLAAADRLPALRRVVVLDGADESGLVTGWVELLGHGSVDLAERAAGLDPESLATIIYTSGSTGAPKGVMLSHRTVRWTIAAGLGGGEAPVSGLEIISYLPLGTVGARMLDHWGHVVLGGAVVTCCPDPDQLVAYAREIRPNLMMGVPAIWEQLHSTLTAAVRADPRRELLEQAVAVGHQLARARSLGVDLPAALVAAAARVDPLLTRLRAAVGLDRCFRAVSGGAPIDPQVLDWFTAVGLPITQTWGMTELTTSVTSDGPTGSVGKPYPGVEVALADDGEVLIRGGLLMSGYYKDPELTAASFDADGWFHTGDLGDLDPGGHLLIIGRKKEIVITAGGTNVSVAKLESTLQRHPLVAQALVVGDRRPYVAALLTLDPDRAAEEPDPAAVLRAHVEAVNAELSAGERVRRYQVVPGPWTVGGGELTANYKKRRPELLARYAEVLEDVYAG